jgi:hypothetical protein
MALLINTMVMLVISLPGMLSRLPFAIEHECRQILLTVEEGQYG